MTRQIDLSEEAYERLDARKRDDETFSDVVVRLTEGRSLLELAGILDDEQVDALRDAIEERRERRRRNLARDWEQSSDGG